MVRHTKRKRLHMVVASALLCVLLLSAPIAQAEASSAKIAYGAFGVLDLGLNKEEVEKRLGEPLHVIQRPRWKPWSEEDGYTYFQVFLKKPYALSSSVQVPFQHFELGFNSEGRLIWMEGKIANYTNEADRDASRMTRDFDAVRAHLNQVLGVPFWGREMISKEAYAKYGSPYKCFWAQQQFEIEFDAAHKTPPAAAVDEGEAKLADVQRSNEVVSAVKALYGMEFSAGVRTVDKAAEQKYQEGIAASCHRRFKYSVMAGDAVVGMAQIDIWPVNENKADFAFQVMAARESLILSQVSNRRARNLE